MRISCSLLLFLTGVALAGEGTGVSMNEYAKKTAELRNLETKMKDAETQIQNYIQAKKASTEPAQQNAAIEGMTKEHHELEKYTKDYNKLRTELKYKFPNHGDEIEGRYRKRQVRSIDDLERGSALDAQLTRTKAVVDKKFEPIIGPKKTAEPAEEQPLKLER
jgi:hypothetical protein